VSDGKHVFAFLYVYRHVYVGVYPSSTRIYVLLSAFNHASDLQITL
jgi:hypothetical protein